MSRRDKVRFSILLLFLLFSASIVAQIAKADEFYEKLGTGLALCNSNRFEESFKALNDSFKYINDENESLNYYGTTCSCHIKQCLVTNISGRCYKLPEECGITEEILQKSSMGDNCWNSHLLKQIGSYFYTTRNLTLANDYFVLSLQNYKNCLNKEPQLELDILYNYNLLLLTLGDYNQSSLTAKRIKQLCAQISCQEEIENRTTYWDGFLQNILETDKKIELTELWNIYGVNSSDYHIDIELRLKNEFKNDFVTPLLDWSYNLFSEISNLKYDRMGIIASPVTIQTDKGELIEGPYIIPELGERLPSGEKIIRISFDHPRSNITYLASRTLALIKGLNIHYRKIINVYSNDEIFSEYPADRLISDNSYVMIWEKNITGILPNSFDSTFHIFGAYFPFVDSRDSFGTIFGLAKPTFKRNWLKEDISIEKIADDDISGRIRHTERMDFLHSEDLKYVAARLLFIGENTRDIFIEPIHGIEIKKPIQAKLNEYNPEYKENQAYISNKEGNTRYIFFFVNSSEKDIELGITYPINFSSHFSKASKYISKLDYKIIFYPGEFPTFDRQYRFTLPEDYEIIDASPKADMNRNAVTFHLEEEFKLRDTISFTFIDIKKLETDKKRNANMIKLIFFIETIMFILCLLKIHYKYKRSRSFLSFVIILFPAVLALMPFFVDLPFFENINSIIFGIITFLIYFIILQYFYKDAKNLTAGNR